MALFALLHFQMFMAALVVFLVAASTDWIDGYVARKTGQVTQLGRILDPFADKIVICGTFIFLAAVPDPVIKAWMAVVVVGRELLVTALRGYLEQHGSDFSATMSGKLKMVFQCAAAVASIWVAMYTPADEPAPSWLLLAAWFLAWLAVLSTIYSGVIYISAALKLVRVLREQ
jgi:CDP-diacylglycerol--glycerol-3-phosphate 3-phosphatidyltransferase